MNGGGPFGASSAHRRRPRWALEARLPAREAGRRVAPPQAVRPRLVREQAEEEEILCAQSTRSRGAATPRCRRLRARTSDADGGQLGTIARAELIGVSRWGRRRVGAPATAACRARPLLRTAPEFLRSRRRGTGRSRALQAILRGARGRSVDVRGRAPTRAKGPCRGRVGRLGGAEEPSRLARGRSCR